MKNWQLTLALLTFGVLLAGCNHESTNTELTEQVTTLQSDLMKLQLRIESLESGDATVSTTEEGFDVAKTNFGSFTVSSRGVSPYLDGYKVKLRIGNLTNADFNGAKLNVAWGSPFETSLEEWRNNQKKKEINLITRFRSGTFTDVEIVLTPAKADEIKSFTVGIELSQLSLRMR